MTLILASCSKSNLKIMAAADDNEQVFALLNFYCNKKFNNCNSCNNRK